MCTETKDARVHCTILNDHTNRHHTPHNREAGERSPLETHNKPPRPEERRTGCPLRTQQCAAGNPGTEVPEHRSSVIPHFSSNPLPPPKQSPKTPGPKTGPGEVLRPSTTRACVHRTFACGHADR